MNIYCFTSILTFIYNTIAYVEITGELTFDVHQINVNNQNDGRTGGNKTEIRNNIVTYKNGDRDGSGETIPPAAPDLPTTKEVNESQVKEDCVYQYPNMKQVDALLGDMTNQLTKIFVRTYEYMGARDVRRGGKRFKILNETFDSGFFEQAYTFMSDEYRRSINMTIDVTKFSRHDPCHHQDDIKRMWLNLLDHSKRTLTRAAVRCINDFLRVRHRADDARTKEKLGQLLLREIKEVRSNQLKVLCDDFKLCYKDLL